MKNTKKSDFIINLAIPRCPLDASAGVLWMGNQRGGGAAGFHEHRTGQRNSLPVHWEMGQADLW